MSNNLSGPLPPLNLPFLDENGNLAPYWHSWMLAIYNRTGGVTGVSSAASIAQATLAVEQAVAAQLTATSGVNSAAVAQTSADGAQNTADAALSGANAANAGLVVLREEVVFANNFRADGIAPIDSPVFSGTFSTALLPKASSDAAAGAIGVQIGQYYVNNSFVSQRQS